MICIGGSRIFYTLLPRVSLLGVNGATFHISGIQLWMTPTLVMFLLVPGMCAGLLSWTVLSDLEGNPMALLYWLAPPITQGVAIALMTAFLAREASKPQVAAWANGLHITAKATSKMEFFNLVVIPPPWFVFMLNCENLHDTDFTLIHNTLVEGSAGKADSEQSKVFILDPAHHEDQLDTPKDTYPLPHQRTRVPTEETWDRLKEEDPGVVSIKATTLSVRRLHRMGTGRDSMCPGLDELFDFM
jgi:hypothetical protein